jgi:alpha-tubulin suppressor-like RCC1 family protein
MSSMPAGLTPLAVSCGNSHTIVLMTDFSIWGCGINTYGQLGITGDTADKSSLTLMSSIPSGKTPLAVSCGYSYTMVLMNDFSIWGCGQNFYGQLGIVNPAN